MSIDEAIFGWLARKVQTLARARRERSGVQGRVMTEPNVARLAILASAAAAQPVEVSLVKDDPGTSGSVVLMPEVEARLPSPDENEELLVLRALVAGALIRAGIRSSAELAARIDEIDLMLEREFTSWPARRDAAAIATQRTAKELVCALAGRPRPGVNASSLALTLPDAGAPSANVTTERESPRRAPPEQRRVLHQDHEAENPLTHSFEKVHTAEDYRGGHKHVDGEDELAAHQVALDELDLDTVVLSNETTRSVYRADLVLSGATGAAGAREGALAYDEWDSAKRRYLHRHCVVTVERSASAADGGALLARVVGRERRAIAATRAEFLRLDAELRWHTRQVDGPAVDLDALVDRSTSLRAGHDATARLYVSRRRRGPSLSMILLVDASMSTDAYVADRRVLDTERDAAAVVALATDGFVELAIAAFCSFSHDDCRYIPLKGFSEPVVTGLGRLAHLAPRGYTRIGPALRHSVRALSETDAERRVVVLLSDGKPTDADRYEGRHGIGDVRQAVREANHARVDVFALAADPRSAPILPAMFGQRGHAGLAAPSRIARAVGGLVTQMRTR